MNENPLSEEQAKLFTRMQLGNIGNVARASVVNRTHRVVRERAKAMEARRSHIRSLWIPIAICSALVVIFASAVWSFIDQYDLAANDLASAPGMPDSSNQFLVLILWFLPVSMALLALVVFRRARKRADSEAA